jgi:hypothetical protein
MLQSIELKLMGCKFELGNRERKLNQYSQNAQTFRLNQSYLQNGPKHPSPTKGSICFFVGKFLLQVWQCPRLKAPPSIR